jgi:hypothetical protein
VRVGCSRSLVTFRGLVLDESTVLFFVSTKIVIAEELNVPSGG